MINKPKRIFLIYLALLTLAGAGIIYAATSKQGPGVSTDAAMMMSAGENLLKIHALVDFANVKLTQFPPLESLLLAFGSLLSGKDVFTVGWALCIIVFAALIWCCGLYFYDAFEDEHLLAYFASFIVFSSASLVQISSNIASDPLFLVLVVLFLMSASAYLRTGSMRSWLLGILLINLACFERYAGLVLVGVGVLMTAYYQRQDLRRAAFLSAIFALAAGGPIVAWGYLHNLPISKEPFGLRQETIPPLNFLSAVEKAMHWFIPVRVISLLEPLALLAIILVSVAILIIVTHSAAVFRRLLTPAIAPSAVFVVIYFAVLVFHLSYRETRGLNVDRVHVIILPALVVVLFTLLSPVLRAARQRFGINPAYGVIIALFAIWCIYPLSETFHYVSQSMAQGDVSAYNSMNSGNVRNSPFAQSLRGLDLRGKPVYTNGPARAWFILDRRVQYAPVIRSEDRQGYLQAHYSHWPKAANGGYLVWFIHESYTKAEATPQELGTVINVQQIYSDSDGAIYTVKAR